MNVSETSKLFYGTHDASILSTLNSDRNGEAKDSYCDAILLVDGEEFKAHKFILGKLSSVFHKMFKLEMKERYDSFANMQGISAETMRIILDFMYTSKVGITKENVLNILTASDYLNMEEIKKFCVEFLQESLDNSNCISYRCVGETLNCTNLVENCGIIMAQQLESVVQQLEFLELEKDKMKALLAKVDQKVVGSKAVYEGLVAWVGHDIETRKEVFAETLEVVKLRFLPTAYLENVVAVEELLLESPKCQKLFQHELFLRLKMPPVIKRYNEESNLDDGHAKRASQSKKKNMFVLTDKGTAVYCFDVTDAAWTQLPKPNKDITGAAAVVHKDKLYLIGGRGSTELIQSFDLNKPYQTNKWKVVGRILTPRTNSKVISFEDIIMIGGGSDKTTFIETFDPVSRSQLKLPSWNYDHGSGYAFVRCNGSIYCLGGSISNMERFSSSRWENIASMNKKYHSITAAVRNEELFVVGARERTTTTYNLHDVGTTTHYIAVESYHDIYQVWRTRNETVYPIPYSLLGSLVYNDRIYCLMRGRDLNTVVLQSFDIMRNTWQTETMIGTPSNISTCAGTSAI